MVDAQLFDRPREEDSAGLGNYAFEVLPRIGETITLCYQDNRDERYEVRQVEYIFADHTKPPQIAIHVERFDPETRKRLAALAEG
jgi:hypothetical protein